MNPYEEEQQQWLNYYCPKKKSNQFKMRKANIFFSLKERLRWKIKFLWITCGEREKFTPNNRKEKRKLPIKNKTIIKIKKFKWNYQEFWIFILKYLEHFTHTHTYWNQMKIFFSNSNHHHQTPQTIHSIKFDTLENINIHSRMHVWMAKPRDELFFWLFDYE